MIINEINSNIWYEKAKSIQGYTFFNSKRWIESISKIFNLKNYYLSISYNENTIYTIVQVDKNKLGYSVFIGYGGLITSECISETLTKEVFISIENYLSISIVRVKGSPFIQRFNYLSEKNNVLALKINSGYTPNKKIRYIFNKINNKLFYIRKVKTEEIDELYDIYMITSKRVKSTYQTPKELFRLMIENEEIEVLGAFDTKEKIHAISIFMYSNKIMHYWWNMSDEISRKEYLNYMLIDHAIKIAIKKNISWLDMATSHSPELELFKKSWGSTKIPFIYLEKTS
jgi:hypothetical protein